MIYRINFIITIVAMTLWISLYVLFFEVLFAHIDDMAGWNQGEVLVFIAFYYVFQSIQNIFYSDGFEGFSRKIRRGEIDPYLTKPISLQLISFFQNIRFDHLIDLAMTGILLGYIHFIHDISFSIFQLGFGLLLAIIGTIMFYGIYLIIASVIFFVDRLEGLNSVMWNIQQLARYPRQIYTAFAKTLFQFIFPIALITSIPAEALLSVNNWGMLIYFVCISLGFLTIGNICFHIGVKHYNSAN